jgi:osmotically-inducible protein OsmY
MKTGKISVLLFGFLIATLSACSSGEKKAPETTTPSTTAADNTAVNDRDSTGATVTPGDQGTSASDLDITAKIRQAVVDDKSLSANAHNVKIITNTGIVTLRGPVKSEQEKSAIEAKAKQVAGVTRVDNQLEIETAAVR